MYSVLDPANAAEPMTLGSQPGSPSSPVGAGSGHVHGGSGYLPGYLMGDSSATTPSSNPRAWGVLPGGSISPAKTRPGLNLSILSGTPTSRPSFFNPVQLNSSTTSRDFHPHQSSDKHGGGPPVQGLFDHPLTPSSAPALRLQPVSSSMDRTSQSGLFTTSPGYAVSDSFVGNKSVIDVTFPPSPAQLDPFYSQGESLKSSDELDECWITVFGFPPAAASYILQQFYHYGNIVDHKMSSNGNWMHLRYQTKLQAKIALSKNGKVFTGNIMVGVVPCIDKAVVNSAERRPPFMSPSLNDSASINTSNCRSLSQPSVMASPVNVAYKFAAQNHTVASPGSVPQKSTGIIAQTLDYVFGW